MSQGPPLRSRLRCPKCFDDGHVRATVLDAFSSNYRLAVVEDACFDRSQASHAINLCDMNAKYADVVPSDDVLAFIETLDEDLFDLPSGAPPQ